MTKIEWNDSLDQQYAFDRGNGKFSFYKSKHSFIFEIQNTFKKYPAKLSSVLTGLYFCGEFHDHIEGFGIVKALDRNMIKGI
jgi:hypothetical protein